MKNQDQVIKYANALVEAMKQVFDADSEFAIDIEELESDDNMTHFTHALSNIAPAFLFRELTGQQMDFLGFNHQSNRLCFQYEGKTEALAEKSEDEQP